jgi:hypothetical protein
MKELKRGNVDMVIDYKIGSMVGHGLMSFVRENNLSSMQFELLRFVGRHPRAKLSFYVMAKALGTAGIDLGNALVGLIQHDILVAEINEHGLSTYSLSRNTAIDKYVKELAALDWSEALSLKKRLE